MSFAVPSTFAAPTLLLGLIAVPIVAFSYIVFEMRREKRAATWVRPAMAPNLVHRPSFRVRHIPAAMFLIGLTLLLVGFARPESEDNSVRQGATIVFTIDISGSMASTDVKPTRLKAADNAIDAFLKVLPNEYRVGVVVFDDTPSILVLPTYDRQLVAASLPKKTKAAGTQIGGALQRAVQVALRAVGPNRPGLPHPPAAVVLFSDGKQTQPGTSVLTATNLAHRSDVPISTIAVGTAGGTVTLGKTLTGGFGKYKTYPTPVDDVTMHGIAIATGGKFWSSPTPTALTQVYQDLGSHNVRQHTQHEISDLATGLALLFIIPGVLLSGLWFRRVA